MQIIRILQDSRITGFPIYTAAEGHIMAVPCVPDVPQVFKFFEKIFGKWDMGHMKRHGLCKAQSLFWPSQADEERSQPQKTCRAGVWAKNLPRTLPGGPCPWTHYLSGPDGIREADSVGPSRWDDAHLTKCLRSHQL
jgi:hypothetical protein